MKKYTSYKDSGVEWLGVIPKNWMLTRLKFMAKICGGQDQKDVIEEDGKYPIFGSGGEFGKTNQYLHEGPSVLLGRKGTIDKPRFVDTPFWTVDTAFFTDILEGTNPRFFFYLCTTINFEIYKYGSAVPSMSRETLNNIPFPYPLLEEQTQIAQYLDRKTSQIDKLITDKEKLIELLNEERSAVISQAVTKGLNPDVPMKDIGIEWLGEVPEHWQLWKLAHAFKKVGGGTTPESGNPLYHQNGTINWLNTGDLNDGVLTNTSKKITQKALEDYSALKVFPPHSVVIAMYGATIAKTSLVTCEITTNQACCVFYDSEVLENKFLFFWFISNKANIINLSKGGGQPNISQEILKSLKVPCPDKNEQRLIIEYIENEIMKSEKLIGKIQQEIQLLKEYKTALISEVVTGKVDVRDEVIAESTELVS